MTHADHFDHSKTFTLDGEECCLACLLEVNDFDADTLARIRDLRPSENMLLGGGAGADFVLERVA